MNLVRARKINVNLVIKFISIFEEFLYFIQLWEINFDELIDIKNLKKKTNLKILE